MMKIFGLKKQTETAMLGLVKHKEFGLKKGSTITFASNFAG
jgi:hypothetical protein